MRILLLLLLYAFFILVLVWIQQEKREKCSTHLYLTTFLSPMDFEAVWTDYLERMGEMQPQRNAFLHRDNSFVSADSIVYRILSKPEYVDAVIRGMNLPETDQKRNWFLSRNHPIEYRRYTVGGRMARHRDTQLYRIPQVECILTLHNSSDCRTEFDTDDGVDSVSSLPNSVLAVRAGPQGVFHTVTEVTRGERCFVKFILTCTNEWVSG